MTVPAIVRRSFVLAILAAPIVGCGGGSSEQQLEGKSVSPEEVKDASKKVLEDRGAMKPAGNAK